jgi:CheY-like chemotaxis protein
MTNTTILFETVAAARFAYDTLQPMIDVSLDCNALTYNPTDKELVKWLVRENYCWSGDKKVFNIYLNKTLILLVDDDINIFYLVGDYLEDKGVKVISASSEQKGWELYCTDKPDLIVSGIAMTSLDCGFRLLQRVREHDRSRPFIFLSGQMRIPGEWERAVELGADACFDRPFELEELFMAIERLL